MLVNAVQNENHKGESKLFLWELRSWVGVENSSQVGMGKEGC